MSSIFNVTDIYGNLIYQGAGTNPGSAGASSVQVSQIIQNAADIGSTTNALAAHAAVAEVHFLIDDEAEDLAKVYSSTHVEALVNTVNDEHRAHADDALVHFTEASINHANMDNVGTNSHAQIDLYIADADIRLRTTTDLITSAKNELDDDIKTNTDLIVFNKGALNDDIKSNTDLIASNSSGIAALLTATGTDASEISINLASIDKNTADIKTNNDLLISNKSALDDDIKTNNDLLVFTKSALDDDIKTNTDLIVFNKSALDDDIKSNTDLLISNKSAIDDDIKSNTDLIVSNKTALDDDIKSNTDLVVSNKSALDDDIKSNTDLIVSNKSALDDDIKSNTDLIVFNKSALDDDIKSNTDLITSNSSGIASLITAIGTGVSEISINLASIDENTADISSNYDAIAQNSESIATNAVNIAQKCPIIAGKIPSVYLPPIAVTNVYVYDTHQNVLDSVVDEGDVAICKENSLTYIYDGSDWQTITAVGAVSLVNGFSGVVQLATKDIAVSDDNHRYFTTADELDIHANEAAAQFNATSIDTIETEFASYRLANEAVQAANSATVDQYIESNDTDVTDYITANDGVVSANASTVDQYIESNNAAFAEYVAVNNALVAANSSTVLQYVTSNDSAVNDNVAALQTYISLNNDAVNDIEVNARAGIDAAALIGDQALQIAQSAASIANNNSSTVDDYISSNNTIVNTTASTVGSYIASNNTVIADYIAANDALVATNSSTVHQYIASNDAAIAGYIAANDGIVLANALTVDQYVASNNTAFADYVSLNDSAVNDNVMALQNYIDLNNDAVNSLGVNARAGIDETALIGDQALQLAQSASTAASNAQIRADSAYSETTSNRALTVEYYGLSIDASTLAHDLAQQTRGEGAVVSGLAQQAQQRADSAYGETTSNRALTVEYYGLAIDASTLAHNLANTAMGEAAVVSGLAQQAQQSADTNLSTVNQYIESNNALVAANHIAAMQATVTQVSDVEVAVNLYTDKAIQGVTSHTDQLHEATRDYISELSTNDIEEPHNVGDTGYGQNLYFTPVRQTQVQEYTDAVAVIATSAKQGMESNTDAIAQNVIRIADHEASLTNVTNESKVTMFSSPAFTGDVTLPALTDGMLCVKSGIITSDGMDIYGSVSDIGYTQNKYINHSGGNNYRHIGRQTVRDRATGGTADGLYVPDSVQHRMTLADEVMGYHIEAAGHYKIEASISCRLLDFDVGTLKLSLYAETGEEGMMPGEMYWSQERELFIRSQSFPNINRYASMTSQGIAYLNVGERVVIGLSGNTNVNFNVNNANLTLIKMRE